LNTQIQAFFFDLDGTLLDSEVLYVDAVREMLARRGFNLNYQESLELVYGKSARDIYIEISARFPGEYKRVEEMNEEIRKNYLPLRDRKDVRIHESINLLKKLAADFAVAIVSGSPRREVSEGIDLMGIQNHLDFFLGAEDYSPGKPDPSCYLRAAEKISFHPRNCLVFEDSTAGVEAAKAAGMYCVALNRTGTPYQDLTAADLILPDLSQFELVQFETGTRKG
jgi:HAD superfamily hydrolase (TIGR01509 family)